MKLIFTFIIFVAIAHASYRSVGEPRVKWKKREISVCFADAQTAQVIYFNQRSEVSAKDVVSFTNEEKKVASEIIMANYRADEVGIGFIGFQDCSNQENADLYLIKFAKEDLSVNAWSYFLGENGVSVCSDDECIKTHYERSSFPVKAYVAINIIPKKRKVSEMDRLRITLLHEFGHVAGLRHEHIRPEALSDPNCKSWMDEIQMDEGSLGAIFGEYDNNSIMSYCYIYHLIIGVGLNFSTPKDLEPLIYMNDKSLFIQEDFHDYVETTINIRLSQGDIHSLKCMYIYNDEQFLEKCSLK